MKQKIADAPADKVELYEKLVSTIPDFTRKGAALPYTSINGNMSSMLMKSGRVALRLPPDDRELFLKKYKTKLVEQYGVVMKEYVEVPDPLLEKTGELAKYFRLSFDYVKGLRPKPTSRKKTPTATKGVARKTTSKKQ